MTELEEAEDVEIERAPVEDVTMEIFYKPHTMLLLVFVSVGLSLLVYFRNADRPVEDNLFTGACVMIGFFLLISTMIMPNGIFTRPHPILWRIVTGASLAYLLLMVGTCFLTLEQARSIMMYISPDLKGMDSKSILSKDYGVNCFNLTWARISADVDHFVLAHFLGWVVKAMLLRHYVLLWVLSINWEITEIAFAHILPNLNECWWDSLVLDVLICNGLGIHVGIWLCRWLEMREYKWESFKDILGTKGKIKRVFMQFTPRFWSETQWLNYNTPPTRGLLLSFLMIAWQ
ncbi:Phosphatidylserine synthase 2, partial [Cichlidogyrus casuarinus]